MSIPASPPTRASYPSPAHKPHEEGSGLAAVVIRRATPYPSPLPLITHSSSLLHSLVHSFKSNRLVDEVCCDGRGQPLSSDFQGTFAAW